jgi:hypothetical protein
VPSVSASGLAMAGAPDLGRAGNTDMSQRFQ